MKWCSAFLSQRGEAISFKTAVLSNSLMATLPRGLHAKALTSTRFSEFIVFVVENYWKCIDFTFCRLSTQVQCVGLLHVKWEGIENSFPHHKALKYFSIVFDCCSPQVDRGILNYLPHENSLREGERLHLAFRIDAFFVFGAEDCVARTHTGQG